MDHEGAGVCAGKSDEGSSDGTVIDLHVTAPANATGAEVVAAGADGAAVLSRAGVAGGLPFLLGADGSYDLWMTPRPSASGSSSSSGPSPSGTGSSSS